MKQLVKKALQGVIGASVRLGSHSRAGRYVLDQIVSRVTARTLDTEHQGLTFTLSCPNSLNYWRIATFSKKEPETLEWIDQLPEGSVLWDIGANVGLYSIYAAKRKRCRVFSFEPSVFNLEILAKNVWLNGLTDRVTLIPLPLSDQLGVNKLNMSSTDWGGALSTFGKDFGHDGAPLNKLFEFQTLGITMQDGVKTLAIPSPDYIKMDVDGIEHLILKGGASVLAGVKQVLVEINDNFSEQAEQAAALLSQSGLVLKDKRHSEMIESGNFRSTFNQIWHRR